MAQYILNFFVGIIIIVIGIVMLKMNFQVTNLFGRNNIFEQKLGSGSTYFVLKIVALLVMFVGLLFVFSLHDDAIDFLISPVSDALGI